jgi:hypothetical protein
MEARPQGGYRALGLGRRPIWLVYVYVTGIYYWQLSGFDYRESAKRGQAKHAAARADRKAKSEVTTAN